MPKMNPFSRKKLISKLKALGFEGPFIATKHQYVIKEKHKIFIPIHMEVKILAYLF